MKPLLSRWILTVLVVPGVVSLVCGPSFGQGSKNPKELTKQQQQTLKGLSKEEVEVLAKVKPNQQVPVFRPGLSGKEQAETVREIDMALANAKRKKLSRQLTMGVRQWEKLSQAQKQQLLTGRGGTVANVALLVAVAVVLVVTAYYQQGQSLSTRSMSKQELDLLDAARLQHSIPRPNQLRAPLSEQNLNF